MAKPKKLAITLPEYERAYRVIRTVDRGIRQDSAPSCLFYNIVGAALVEKVLGVAARPAVGSAFLRVSKEGNTLAFADCMDGKVLGNNFHCWVKTAEHVIDFTAPVYQGYLANQAVDWTVPVRMFQRRREESARSLDQLDEPGDFLFLEDVLLTQEHIQKATRSLALGDLYNVCATWLTRPPKPIRSSMSMTDDLGKITHMRLDGTSISTAW